MINSTEEYGEIENIATKTLSSRSSHTTFTGGMSVLLGVGNMVTFRN